MVLRKSIAVSAFYCNSPLYSPLSPPPATPRRHTARRASLQCSSPYFPCRWYAVHSDSNTSSTPPSDPDGDDTNPPPWPSSKSPTPYDIFAIARSDPYTKKRFYQLVKVYHPDLGHHPICASLAPDVRLERYRLVIAANDLLSDPAKRRAYDAHGLGWAHPHRTPLRDVDRSWRYQPGSAAANATWEDWERWHEARGEGQDRGHGAEGKGKSQGPVFMPNGVFAMLIAMTCIVGAMLQSQRAGGAGAQYLETKAERDRAVGREVQRTTEATAGLSKDERVGRFLRDRENVAFDYVPGRYEPSSGDEGAKGESN
ncbi:J domain-containing protein 1 [Amphichorda felina]